MINKKEAWVLFALIVILVGGSIIYSSGSDSEITLPSSTANTASTTLSFERLTLEHSFADGMHTLSGTFHLPAPCYQFTYNTRVAESFPEQVMIDFTLTPPDPAVVCIQMVSEQAFNLQVEASEQATFSARVNTIPINLSLKEKANTEISATTTPDLLPQ
jgi:hypothetical protein